jgi:hypothetical protein
VHCDRLLDRQGLDFAFGGLHHGLVTERDPLRHGAVLLLDIS